MFNIDNSITATSAASTILEGNKIHTVKFKGAEATTLEAKSGESYKVVQFKFENEDGSFTDTIFEPSAEDGTRKPNQFGGENPSNNEQMIAKIRHYIAALNPALSTQLDNNTKQLSAKTWDDFRAIMVAAVAKGVDNEVQIKLLKNKNQMATFPGFPLSISQKGATYMTTNFIANNGKLAFNEKERKAIDTVATAKATDMGTKTTASTSAGSDLDFDINDL